MGMNLTLVISDAKIDFPLIIKFPVSCALQSSFALEVKMRFCIHIKDLYCYLVIVLK